VHRPPQGIRLSLGRAEPVFVVQRHSPHFT
jgi:hypothetical protein